jgi:hypothetical protein
MTVRMSRFGAVLLGGALFATPALGGVISSQAALGTSFAGTPTIATTLTPDVNATQTSGGRTLQTFTTGASGFQLDRLAFVVGGGPGTITFNVYKIQQTGDPWGDQGGKESQGFVNRVTPSGGSTGLLGVAGAGLSYTWFGTASSDIITLDLTGVDEIALAPNSVYAVALNETGDTNFFTRRGASSFYTGGNLYGWNSGTQYFDVAGTKVDAPLAVYAVPEPTGLAMIGVGALAVLSRRRRA